MEFYSQLEKANVDMRCIHHMFVTHAHTDHVLGVIWVIRKIATLLIKVNMKESFIFIVMMYQKM